MPLAQNSGHPIKSAPDHTPTLFTLGYEGMTIESFIVRLQAAQVKTVVDVRELPLSRKKGFSEISILRRLVSHWWKKR